MENLNTSFWAPWKHGPIPAHSGTSSGMKLTSWKRRLDLNVTTRDKLKEAEEAQKLPDAVKYLSFHGYILQPQILVAVSHKANVPTKPGFCGNVGFLTSLGMGLKDSSWDSFCVAAMISLKSDQVCSLWFEMLVWGKLTHFIMGSCAACVCFIIWVLMWVLLWAMYHFLYWKLRGKQNN